MVKRDSLPDAVIKRIEEVNADDTAPFEQAQIRFEREFQKEVCDLAPNEPNEAVIRGHFDDVRRLAAQPKP